MPVIHRQENCKPMAGYQNQETGDWGEAIVRNALADEDISVIELKPDLGEDFLIEIEGRKAAAEGLYPLRALVQVKAHSDPSNSDIMKVALPMKAIIRWSAQPWPVFILGVSGRKTPSLFLTSLDEVLTDSLQGRDPALCEQKTVTVNLKLTHTLATSMAFSIKTFTRTLVPDFGDLTKEEIEANHFEILKEQPPTSYQRAVQVGWSILWKSPRRPQFFSAMFRELIKRAKRKYAHSDKPVEINFHIYRSLRDQQHNMAVAHIDWVNDEDHRFSDLRELFPWAPYRVRQGHDNDETRKYISGKTATAHEFASCVQRIGTVLDGMTATILQNETTRTYRPWSAELISNLTDTDRIWNEMPQAPIELATAEKFISNYLNALDDNRWMRDPSANITQSQRERWYPQNIAALAGYYLAWPLILRTSGWST